MRKGRQHGDLRNVTQADDRVSNLISCHVDEIEIER
jgi:hypothetical protein